MMDTKPDVTNEIGKIKEQLKYALICTNLFESREKKWYLNPHLLLLLFLSKFLLLVPANAKECSPPGPVVRIRCKLRTAVWAAVGAWFTRPIT